MGLQFGGYVFEVCVVSAEVGDLEGWQVLCALCFVRWCTASLSTLSLLVLVGFLFHDVKLNVGRKAAKGFPE